MPEIIVRFQRIDKDAPLDAPVPVTVHYGGKDTERFDFINPLTVKELGEIRWYLEQYYRWPVGPDYDRAGSVEKNLPVWGRALFDAVFRTDANALAFFREMESKRQEGEPTTFTIDTIEPNILTLPWELLCDEGGYLFSKNPPLNIRRRMHQKRTTTVRRFELPIRILMVVSRPDEVASAVRGSLGRLKK